MRNDNDKTNGRSQTHRNQATAHPNDGRCPRDTRPRGESPQLFSDEEYKHLFRVAYGENDATENRVVVTHYDDQDAPVLCEKAETGSCSPRPEPKPGPLVTVGLADGNMKNRL
jgi:hypothetical protein